MKKKITINQGKKFVRELAKKHFPKRHQKLWTFKITEWFDGDFSIEYKSGVSGGKGYNIFLYYTEKKKYYEIVETKLIKEQYLTKTLKNKKWKKIFVQIAQNTFSN